LNVDDVVVVVVDDDDDYFHVDSLLSSFLSKGMEKSDRGNSMTVPSLSSFVNIDNDDSNNIERLSLDLDINNDVADSNYDDRDDGNTKSSS